MGELLAGYGAEGGVEEDEVSGGIGKSKGFRMLLRGR